MVALPDGVSFNEGAAAVLQGCLSQSTYPIKKGDNCLIHAAAGGVGLILTQMTKNAGATVVGTVSTQEKAELARAADEARKTRLLSGPNITVVKLRRMRANYAI